MDDKYLELSNRSNKLFNITRKTMKVYETERKKLYEYYINGNANLKEWEDFIIDFETKVKI